MRGRWMLFLFLRKGSMGLMLPQGQAYYGWSGKSPHLRFSVLLFRSYFPPKLCVRFRPTTSVSLEKRNQHTPIFGRIKKNVTMDKQKINTTSSMSRKGYSSSSHYRISSGLGEHKRAVATKFVQWETQPLETLRACKAYLLREKLNRGEAMSREEKDWLCEAVNSNTYFRTAIPVMGYRFDFFDVLRKHLIRECR